MNLKSKSSDTPSVQEPDIQEYEGDGFEEEEDDSEFQIEAPQEYLGPLVLPQLPLLPVMPVLQEEYQGTSASGWVTYLRDNLLAWRSETIHLPPQEVQGYRK